MDMFRFRDLVLLSVFSVACGVENAGGNVPRNLSGRPDGGLGDLAAESPAASSNCAVEVNAELEVPAGLDDAVTGVTTDGTCVAGYGDGGVSVGEGTAKSCQVTVHLKDGTSLTASVTFRPASPGTPCFGSAIDATTLTETDDGGARDLGSKR